MDSTLAAIISGLGVLAGGKLIDHWLGRSKAKQDQRAGALTEVEKLWARNDRLQTELDTKNALLADEIARRELLEERNHELRQRLTPALLAIEHYQKYTNIPPPPKIIDIKPEPPQLSGASTPDSES